MPDVVDVSASCGPHAGFFAGAGVKTIHRFRVLCISVLAFLAIAMGTPAQAQQVKTVNANDVVVLDRAPTAQMMTITLMPGVGAAQVVNETGATQALVYLAPPNPPPAPVSLTYTKSGMPVTLSITVTDPLPAGFTPETYDASFKALFVLFVLAVLLENALNLIFHWKPYLIYFDSRTVNALVSFAIALVFIHSFQLDIVSGLLNAISMAKYPAGWFGEILTALIVAGGSAGVNRIFRALGFRPMETPQPEEKPKPTPSEAFVSISLRRKQAVGPVDVVITPQGEKETIAGSIIGSGGIKSWRQLFLRDQGRFPPSGGHRLVPNVQFQIFLKGIDRDGKTLTSQPWGPNALAGGAIIDLEQSL